MFWRSLIAAILVGLSCSWIEAQAPRNRVSPETQREAMERQQQQRQQAQNEQLILDQLKRGDVGSTDSNVPPFDKETFERVKQFRKVDPEVVKTYSAFLKIHGTGITKFFPYNGCLSAVVISASDKCRDFIPHSYAFSFRTKGYSDSYYSDIAFKDTVIVAGSFFAQGAILSLGDLPIEGIGLDNPAVKFLSEIPTDKDFETAMKTAQRLQTGYGSGGMTVSTLAKPRVNNTYVVRVIAYKMGADVPPLSASSTSIEKKFLILDHDSRGDIVAVFRIVDVRPEGTGTVIWRLLDRKDAPKRKFGKDQNLADFRP